MANYQGIARSNYFKVTDLDAFRTWLNEKFPSVQMQVRDDLVALFPESDDGSWPSYDLETDEEIDFPAELGAWLADGEVAILQEVGFEKRRYLVGQSIAITRAHDEVSVMWVDLSEIYAKVKAEWGIEPTRAEY